MSTAQILVTVVLNVITWVGVLTIYLLHELPADSSETELSPKLTFVLAVVAALGALASSVNYLVWEYLYGDAFSYFFPLHGARRIDDLTWRLGIVLKTKFVSVWLLIFIALLLTHDTPFTISGVRVITPVTPLQLLLVGVTQTLLTVPLLVYTVAGHYYAVKETSKR